MCGCFSLVQPAGVCFLAEDVQDCAKTCPTEPLNPCFISLQQRRWMAFWRAPQAQGRPSACCVPPWPGGSTSRTPSQPGKLRSAWTGWSSFLTDPCPPGALLPQMEMSQVSTTTSALRDVSQHVLLAIFYNKYTIINVVELLLSSWSTISPFYTSSRCFM